MQLYPISEANQYFFISQNLCYKIENNQLIMIFYFTT